MPRRTPEISDEIKEAMVGIVGYLVIGLLRPSWITRHLQLSFAQHFRRLFLTRGFVLMASPYLKEFGERAEATRDDLRRELGREPTAEELVTRIEQAPQRETRWPQPRSE